MDTSFAVPLQAKRTARDEKLKKLQNLLSHKTVSMTTTGESSAETAASSSSSTTTTTISSYQHGGAPDVESGSGHIVVISGQKEGEEPKLLREQMQSLIHLEEEEEDNRRGINGSSTCASMMSSSENLVNNMEPQCVASDILVVAPGVIWKKRLNAFDNLRVDKTAKSARRRTPGSVETRLELFLMMQDVHMEWDEFVKDSAPNSQKPLSNVTPNMAAI
eukprot:scaffold1182_cov165-Amphora_coffeaeformis.AAC.15